MLAGPRGDLPGARSAVTVPGKRAAGSGWAGASCGPERGAEPGWHREPAGRPAALCGGWDRQEAKWLLFLMRALVTFEDRRPQAGSRYRAETEGFLSAAEDPGEPQSLGAGDAVAWTRQLEPEGAESATPAGTEGLQGAVGPFPGSPRWLRLQGSHCLMSCD